MNGLMMIIISQNHKFNNHRNNFKTDNKMKEQTETKIKSITEAFSMQPRTWCVCKEKLQFGTNEDIAEIKLERTGPDEFYDYLYRAYNFDGQKIFEWQPKAVNVEYFTK